MRRVWDTFLFCNELDLLECRLMELDESVYRFILVESPVTHQGRYKPLHYSENKERFAPWEDKIIHIVADLTDCNDVLAREQASRDAVMQGLGDFRKEDLFLHSDVDEIPFPCIIQNSDGHILTMRKHEVAVNLIGYGWWAGTMAGHDPHLIISQFRYRQSGDFRRTIRDSTGMPVVCGSHFSWIGGPSEMRAKANAFIHSEMAGFIDSEADDLYKNRISPSGKTHLVETVIDETWPVYMQQRRGPASWYWPGE